MEVAYAQFLNAVETLEVVVERLEVSRCEVLVDLNGKVTAESQESVRRNPRQCFQCESLAISTYIPLSLSER